MPTPIETARTRPSTMPARRIGIPRGGISRTRALRNHNAASSPPVAANAARMRLSTRSCIASRRPPAPIASRIVISCRRAKERTSRRLPTFAHAMSRRTVARPTRDTKRGEKSPGVVERRPPQGQEADAAAAIRWPGNRTPGVSPPAEISSCACASVAPGLSRTNPSIQRCPRSSSLYGVRFEGFLHRHRNPELTRVPDEGPVEALRGDADDRVLRCRSCAASSRESRGLR